MQIKDKMQPSIVKNTISLLFSKLVPSLVLTIINIVYSRYLTKDDYGMYQTIFTYLNIFVVISTFGLTRYILSFGSLYQYRPLLRVKLLSVIFIITLLPIVLYLQFTDSTLSVTSLTLFVILLLSQSLYLVQEANVLSFEKNKLLIFPNLIYALLLLACHILLLYIGYSIERCLLALIAVSVIRNVGVAYYIKNEVQISTYLSSIKEVDQLIWFGINDVLQIMTKWIDKIILILLLSAADYAVYFNGTYEIPLIGMGLSAFQSIITARSAKADATNESNIALFGSSALFMSGILFPLFGICFFFAHEIILLLFGEKYVFSAELFAITSLLIPMRICNYTVLLQIKSKGNLILIGALLDFVVAVVLMFLFYPIWGLKGLALAIVIATYVQAAFYLFNIVFIYRSGWGTILPWLKLVLRFSIVILSFFSLRLVLGLQTDRFSVIILSTVLFVFLLIGFNFKSLSWKQLFRS
ncbi:MAG: oligosaccharide flippase family protein [Bacteroidia bacterium]|nr:oligosaccharide flippase family protein [Bacteroidia bacterium]